MKTILAIILLTTLAFGAPEFNIYSDLNMNGNKITDAGNPTLDNDLSTKEYVDDATNAVAITIKDKLDKTGDIMSGDLNMGENSISSISSLFLYDSVNRFDGSLVFDNNNFIFTGNSGVKPKIQNIADPTLNQDVATKKYVDDNSGGGDLTIVSNQFLLLSGYDGTPGYGMSGSLPMNGNEIWDSKLMYAKLVSNLNCDIFKIINLGTPTAAGDGVNKLYVDNAIAGVGGGATVAYVDSATNAFQANGGNVLGNITEAGCYIFDHADYLAVAGTSLTITKNMAVIASSVGAVNLETLSVPGAGIYTILFNDNNITVINNDTPAAGNINLEGTVNFVTKKGDTLQLFYNGFSFFQTGKSIN